MSDEYGKPAITPIAFDFATAPPASDAASITLSGKDVLGIVQSAFEDLGPTSERLIEVKREVLAEVARGRPAHALRTAIVGAGKSCCTCCC
jgi:hypothetical protein